MDFFETVGKLASVSGCITATAAVVLLIVSVVKRAKAPNALQDKRIEELERIVARHEECLARDLKRFERMETGNRIMQRCMLALLSHGIDGNDIEGMKEARADLQAYLINH